MKVFLVGVAVAASSIVSACPRSQEPTPKSVHESSTKSGDGPLGPVERVKRATTGKMGAHFGDVVEIHTSLVHGALDDARKAARELADDRPDVVLEEWAPYLLALRGTAEDLGRAGSLEEAAPLAASLAKTCGDCHEAQGARLELIPGAPPPKSDDNAERMRRHAWAFNRLWEGLVLPSDESWRLGVDAFVELPECEDSVSAEADRAAIADRKSTRLNSSH